MALRHQLMMLDGVLRVGCSGGAGLAHCLMEADVTVFKARIRTGTAKQVTDEFWVYDNRCELPNEIRWDQCSVCMLLEHLSFCIDQRAISSNRPAA